MCSHDSAYVLYKHDIRAIDVRVVVELKLKRSLKHTMTVGPEFEDTSKFFFFTFFPQHRLTYGKTLSKHILRTSSILLSSHSILAYMPTCNIRARSGTACAVSGRTHGGDYVSLCTA